MRPILRAGVLTAMIDGTFATVQAYVYDSTFSRLFQGVSSTLLGQSAYDGGALTAAVGVAMHMGVACGWAAVFWLLQRLVARLQKLSWPGVLAVALAYGPLIWCVMSLAVIPVLTQRPPTISRRWWGQLFGHILFVALPIVATLSRDRTGPRSRSQAL